MLKLENIVQKHVPKSLQFKVDNSLLEMNIIVYYFSLFKP
jgi:hypothetical protein